VTPASATGLDTADVLSAQRPLREIELAVSRKLEGLLHGDHAGALPGPGTEAGEGRRYEPGDDVRRIDWNLSARTNEIHVRDTISERELETWFVVDTTASVDYGTANHEKRDLAVAVVAAFGFMTARPGNRSGAVLFDGDGARVLPARAGRVAAVQLLAQVRSSPRSGGGEGSLEAALRRVRLLAPRGGLVVVVSDLLDQSDWPTELRALGVRHDVIVAHLTDPREDEIPAVGMLTLVDPETGQRHEVQTSSRKFRERYRAAAAERRDGTRGRIRAGRAESFEVATDGDWLKDVVRFVSVRGRRR